MPGPPQSEFLAGENDPNVSARWARAVQLRAAGLGYDRIAKECGYASGSGAYQAVQAALRATIQEPADELRRIEVERLDMACLAIAGDVRKGHLGAVDRWIKLADRRAKLLGLDAPIKQDFTTQGGPLRPSTVEIYAPPGTNPVPLPGPETDPS
jgi:hypothetical protein